MPVKRLIAEGRPHTWSELILQKEIEDAGSSQEYRVKRATLAHNIKALDDSLRYGLVNNTARYYMSWQTVLTLFVIHLILSFSPLLKGFTSLF